MCALVCIGMNVGGGNGPGEGSEETEAVGIRACQDAVE
jgi:hypothetical protein